jgi:hypothetical protein
MNVKHSARYKIIRGGLMAGSILSFIPAFALVRANSTADGNSSSNPAAVQTSGRERDDDDDRPSNTLPSYQQPSTQSSSPTQSRSQVVPRVRTRAS